MKITTALSLSMYIVVLSLLKRPCELYGKVVADSLSSVFGFDAEVDGRKRANLALGCPPTPLPALGLAPLALPGPAQGY